MNNREWFAQAKCGMMIHFGLYSPLGDEWLGSSLTACGINYLFNIDPDPLGRLPAPAMDILRKAR